MASNPGRQFMASNPGRQFLASNPGIQFMASNPGRQFLASNLHFVTLRGLLASVNCYQALKQQTFFSLSGVGMSTFDFIVIESIRF